MPVSVKNGLALPLTTIDLEEDGPPTWVLAIAFKILQETYLIWMIDQQSYYTPMNGYIIPQRR